MRKSKRIIVLLLISIILINTFIPIRLLAETPENGVSVSTDYEIRIRL